MDYKEKILAGVLIFLVFSYAMNHYKNQQMEEAYENMNRSEIEIKSSDFSDLNQEELKILREEMEEVERIENEEANRDNTNTNTINTQPTIASTTTTQPPPADVDADLVIPKDPDNQKKIQNLEYRIKSLNNFEDVASPEPTEPNTNSEPMSLGGTQGMTSVFNPQIIIKEGDSGKNVSFKIKDNEVSIPLNNMGGTNWSVPTHNLWSDDENSEDNKAAVIDTLNAGYNNSYRNSTNRHNIINSGNAGNTGTPNGYQTDGENSDPNYQNSPKTFYPGYSYMPPSNWNVPQRRAPICTGSNPDTTKLPIGVADHGTPINALEVDPIGRILATEEMVKHTNVGSILPKFTYRELSNSN